MHGLELMAAYNRSGRTSPRQLVTGNSIQDDGGHNNPDDIDVTTRHALVLGGVVIFIILCFLAYLLCHKSPPPQQRPYVAQHQNFVGQQGDRRQGEEDLPPSYNQLEHMDLLLKTPFSGPPPSYDEVGKGGMT